MEATEEKPPAEEPAAQVEQPPADEEPEAAEAQEAEVDADEVARLANMKGIDEYYEDGH